MPYSEVQIHAVLVWAMIVLAVATFVYLTRVPAPYGRHYKSPRWGPHIPNKLGWVIMELPATAAFASIYFAGERAWESVPLVFLFMWQAHYLHRTFVYPFRTRTKGRHMPLMVVGTGVLFNSLNAYVNARFISSIAEYGTEWLTDPRFLTGAVLFLCGMALNVHADNTLLQLRKTDDATYSVPHRGAFQYVSCPNYLGEIVEWAGWAVATWSTAGFAFFLYTAANLIPRARSNHDWYRTHFPDYPRNRKALIPGIL